MAKQLALGYAKHRDLDIASVNTTLVEESWGSHSVKIQLPASSVLLTGISLAQKISLKSLYSGFISNTATSENESYIECAAYQLGSPINISLDEISIDGQYTPIKKQNSGKLYVTGTNFVAQIALNTPGASATIGVVAEKDFMRPDVVENFLRIYTAHKALVKKGVMLHSAGLVFNGQAYIFAGRSNAGKTTLTSKAYNKGAHVLSDDINIVLPAKKPDNNLYDAYAVPFTGEFGRTLDHTGGKKSYPVAGIVLLEQSDHLETLPVTSSEAVARLLTGCPFVNTDESESEALFDSVTRLVSKVPVVRLLSRKNDDIDDMMFLVKKQLSL